MARGDHAWYVNGLRALMNKEVDLDTDTIKVMLVDNSYTPNYDTHDFKSDVTGELSGTGYTAGGNAIGSKAISVDSVDHEAVLDGADVTWTGINAGTAEYAIVYQDTGVASTSVLLSAIHLAALATNGGDLTLQWNTEGILNLTKA